MPFWAWQLLIGLGVCLVNVTGVALTVLMLPGIWVMLLGAGLAQWWSLSLGAQPREPMFSWWTLGVCAILATAAEVIELIASALGSSKFGGSRRGALGSIVGAIVGAIVGSMLLPLVGTILGAAIGAGLGAVLTERHVVQRTWREAGKSGAGAALGRLAATLVKTVIAVVVAVVLSVAAFV